MFGKSILVYTSCRAAFERLCCEDKIKLKVIYKNYYVGRDYSYTMYSVRSRKLIKALTNAKLASEEKIDELNIGLCRTIQQQKV